MKKILLLPLLLLMVMSAGAQCVASFTYAQNPTGGYLLRYTFTNTSTVGSLVNKQKVDTFFNYGDGTSSFNSNTTHDYATPGIYYVGMRILKFDSSHSLICTDTTTQMITVAYTPCGSTFSYPSNINSNIRTFTAHTPAGTTGMTYSWNFGDGTTGTGSPVSHSYTSTGYFTVIMTATHATAPSCSYSYQLVVLVYYLECDSLHSSFTYTRSGYSVTATPYSSWFPGLSSAFSFDYGDGSPVTSATTHTYAKSGNYTIKEKGLWLDSVTSALKCQDSNTKTVRIFGSMYGYITYDSLTFTGTQPFNVYLIQYDSATSMLRAVDSQSTASTGYVWYNFSNVSGGNYLVKAVRPYTVGGASGLVPTYHDSSLYWSGAQYVSNTGYSASTQTNIWMRNGAATTGPGFIGGNVSLGANKGTANGVEGVNVLLRNNANQVVASALTDNAGDFTFNYVPVGSYSVYPEVMNYATMPASSINITAAAPTVNGLYFHKDDVKMNIMMHSLGAPTIINGGIYARLSPNPATQSVTLSWAGKTPGNAKVVITNTTGQTVASHSLDGNSGSGQQAFDVSTLKAGIYFVRIISDVAGSPMKLIIQ